MRILKIIPQAFYAPRGTPLSAYHRGPRFRLRGDRRRGARGGRGAAPGSGAARLLTPYDHASGLKSRALRQRRHARRRNEINARTRKITKMTLAIQAAVAAKLQKPRIPAMMAMIRKTTA